MALAGIVGAAAEAVASVTDVEVARPDLESVFLNLTAAQALRDLNVDLSAIWIMAVSDLRQRIRDRIGIDLRPGGAHRHHDRVQPVVLRAGLFGVAETDHCSGGRRTRRPGCAGLIQALSAVDGLKVTATLVALSSADDLAADVESGSVTVGVVFPAGFDAGPAGRVTQGGADRTRRRRFGTSGGWINRVGLRRAGGHRIAGGHSGGRSRHSRGGRLQDRRGGGHVASDADGRGGTAVQ